MSIDCLGVNCRHSTYRRCNPRSGQGLHASLHCRRVSTRHGILPRGPTMSGALLCSCAISRGKKFPEGYWNSSRTRRVPTPVFWAGSASPPRDKKLAEGWRFVCPLRRAPISYLAAIASSPPSALHCGCGGRPIRFEDTDGSLIGCSP